MTFSISLEMANAAMLNLMIGLALSPVGCLGMDNMKSVVQESQEISMTKDCPHLCMCPTPEKVDCRSAKLTNVPHNISHSVVYLLLNKNRLSQITSDCFKACPSVRTLNLDGNKISDQSISEEAFQSLLSLNHLYLSDNELQKIPPKLPDSLISLNLEGNSIGSIEASALGSKHRLRQLYLHSNKIRSEGVSDLAFVGLHSLEEVTLSHNLIQSIPNFPNSIERVHLMDNKISSIPEGAFRNKKKLLSLYLQRNNLKNKGLHPRSFLGLKRIQYLDLSNNKLTEIPQHFPRSLIRLHLEKNSISKISSKSLSHLKKLQYLLIQYNQLNSSGIEKGSFLPLKRLKTLHLFSNKLEEIPDLLPSRLDSLVLLSNNIHTLKRGTFFGNRKLRDLNLRYNEITNIGLEKGSFRPLAKLVSIDLTGNNLKAVPSLPRNVQVVYLTGNKIVRIPVKSLSRLRQLRHLSLKDNKLKDEGIPDRVFRLNSALKVLDLSHNLLKVLPPYLPPSLEYLYIHHNQITKVRKNAFRGTPLLRGIFLQENQLTPKNVAIEAFHTLRFLEKVDISWRSSRSKETLSRKKRWSDSFPRERFKFRSKKFRFRVHSAL